jgi:aryl-alcohol dehydrogenase-like predicted oxidoreductase
MARLRAAFTRLEAEADAGRIRFYGVATWQGLRAEEHDRQYLPLFLLARLAQEVGGAQHRCRFVQLPYNLTMPEAFFTRNQVMERAADDGATQRQSVPLLAAAVQHGIAAMTSASLRQTQVLGRVPASVKQVLGPELSEAQVALHFARSTPGVTTALVGMRQVEHVAENLAVAALPPLPATDFLKRFTRRG